MDEQTEPYKIIHWSWWKKAWIGFISTYFSLFSVPFLLEYISPSGYLGELHTDLWNPLVVWVSENIFHGYPLTSRPSGVTGDTTWNYIHLFCLIVLSLFTSILSVILERDRLNYEKLYEWFQRYIRYALALAMISYGMVKVIKSQFDFPSLDTLIRPLGDTSPSRMLWAFMGISVTYSFFAGLGEVVSGILMFFRRTKLLGSLLCIGVMSNVVMLNYSYDIAVKIYSFHLLLMAVVIASPDIQRLVNLFLLNRPVMSVAITSIFHRKLLNQGALFLKTTVLILFLLWQGKQSFGSWQQSNTPTLRSALRGIWNVEEFDLDGKIKEPLITDTSRWRRVIFDYPESGSVQFMNDRFVKVNVTLDTEKRRLNLNNDNEPKWKADLTYEKLTPDFLTMTGTINNQLFRVKLRRSEESLTSRIYTSPHFIHEKSSFSH